MCALTGACSSVFVESTDEVSSKPSIATQSAMEEAPAHGGDLFIAIPDGVTMYDPLLATNEDLVNFYTLMYETPFAYDESGRLVNDLIDTWDVSSDGRTFTFRIRDDVYFSDGIQLTANDVYESARRALNAAEEAQEARPTQEPTQDPESTGSPLPTASVSVSTDGSYARRFADYGSGITSMDLVDDNTISITTQSPGNAALHFMTFPVTKADFSENDLPVGTGPYSIIDVNENGQIILEANPYWRGDEPYIDRIVANPVSGPREKIEMQQTSRLDFITTDALNAGNYSVSGNTTVVDYMTNYFDCLVPNLADADLADINVRRAISEALDRREVLSTVLINHGVPSTLPIEPDSFVVDARFRSNQRNISGALDRLRTSGYRYEENGEGKVLNLELIVADSLENSYRKEAARAIKKQLAEVYIEVEVVVLKAEEFVTRLQTGSYDLAYCSFYMSPFADLEFLFRHDGASNFNHFYDQQVEDALDACAQAITEQELIDAYTVLQELLNAQLPIIGLYFRMNSIICNASLGGLSHVREGTIFADIPSWYITSTMQSVATATASPTPQPATMPESWETAEPSPGFAGQTSADHTPGSAQGESTPTQYTSGPPGGEPDETNEPEYSQPAHEEDTWEPTQTSDDEQPTESGYVRPASSEDSGDDREPEASMNIGGLPIVIPPDSAQE